MKVIRDTYTSPLKIAVNSAENTENADSKLQLKVLFLHTKSQPTVLSVFDPSV